MASSGTFPNPCLVAILLVCHTRIGSGAQILFHYPPGSQSDSRERPTESSSSNQPDKNSSTDSEESSTDEDDLFALPGKPQRSTPLAYAAPRNNGDVVDEENVRNPSQANEPGRQRPGQIFGLAEDGLVSLLSPERAWHKRKFELGINDLTFVGWPVFVRPDGQWARKRRRKERALDSDLNASDTATDIETTNSLADSSNLDESKSNARSPLTMFHVVFVMNPPPLEHAMRVKDMYKHVIKKFSMILKGEQAHNDYVWKQSEIILTVKSSKHADSTSPSTLCAQILAKSSLAVAISHVYNAISSSRIASVNLSPDVAFSLQIPPVTSTPYLPCLTDPPIQPGLWLTTATDIGSTGAESESPDARNAVQLAKHYTLLLKSPPHRIAKDAIEAGGPLAAHLPKFLSLLRPTKSFYKLFVSSNISLADIQDWAQHLIDWRRAVAIPPLHQKDVYIVSPNADMRKLREATKSYEQHFAPTMPNMPSLPKILSDLSGIPRTFGSLIPSTDHKEQYYLALAWLMRHGWVTQLRTFLFVRVDPDIKRAVREKDRESRSRYPTRQVMHREDTGSARDFGKPRKRPSIISRPSSEGKRSTEGNGPTHNPRMASLVLNPPRASLEESAWLEYMEAMLTSNEEPYHQLSSADREELRKYWPSLLKYFNGLVAVEAIPAQESLKRRFVWSLLAKMGLDLERGVEDRDGNNSAILVPFRHW